MLILSEELYQKPIISVRTGSRIGTVVSPIINPANLHIDGFYSQNNRGVSLILQDLNIREFGPKGIIINEPSDLTELEELIRIKPVVELKFELIGKGVVSSVEKIGSVVDYAVDKNSLFVHKLFVEPAIWKSLVKKPRIISRDQIIDINDKQIVVEDTAQKSMFKNNLLATNDS